MYKMKIYYVEVIINSNNYEKTLYVGNGFYTFNFERAKKFKSILDLLDFMGKADFSDFSKSFCFKTKYLKD